MTVWAIVRCGCVRIVFNVRVLCHDNTIAYCAIYYADTPSHCLLWCLCGIWHMCVCNLFGSDHITILENKKIACTRVRVLFVFMCIAALLCRMCAPWSDSVMYESCVITTAVNCQCLSRYKHNKPKSCQFSMCQMERCIHLYCAQNGTCMREVFDPNCHLDLGIESRCAAMEMLSGKWKIE